MVRDHRVHGDHDYVLHDHDLYRDYYEMGVQCVLVRSHAEGEPLQLLLLHLHQRSRLPLRPHPLHGGGDVGDELCHLRLVHPLHHRVNPDLALRHLH